MVCLHPMWLKKEGFAVPCGRCMACKIMRTHAWATRLMMERPYWKDAAFITLTYEDRFLPPTLRPRHLQLFFKRLRRDLDGRKIKYFACGEYGEKGNLVLQGPRAGKFVHRPHYHAIVFGLSPTYDRSVIKENWPYCNWPLLESSSRGRKAIGTVTYDSCRYVAGYVQKKLYGEKAKQEYDAKGQVAPFVRMSKGLGLQFAFDNRQFLEDNLQVGIRNYVVALPRYLRDKLEIDPQKVSDKHFDFVKERYQKYIDEHHFTLNDDEKKLKMFNYREYADSFAANKQREVDMWRKNILKSDNLEFDLC